MRYHNSMHFREDPLEEVDAALAAGNSPDSVRMTLEARLLTEEAYTPRDAHEIERLQQQLAHFAIAMEVEIAA